MDRVELISFLVSGMVLCFGFLIKIAVKTQWCSSCCRALLAESQGLFGFSHCQQGSGGAPGAGKRHRQLSWPRLAKGIQYNTTWCNTEQ